MRDPNAKTLVNKALADEMRASARKALRTSSGSTPTVQESGSADSAPPSTPTP